MTLFEKILETRGLKGKKLESFLDPKYKSSNDPYLLPDVQKAIERLKMAHHNQEPIIIYGDYDIDGITATTLLIDAFESFGFKNVNYFIPSRFKDGFGLNSEAIKSIHKMGASLIVTVDCGSTSQKEIELASSLGMDVIVTDHHQIESDLPSAIAIINPKRSDSKYPFKNLAGVGVAFKLVQAMQKSFKGLSDGQEKWLLDLVALGTVCDVVDLVDENRMLTYYGLQVLSKTRRKGLIALSQIVDIDMSKINSYHLGFIIGPRLNAAGRIETARQSIKLMLCEDIDEAKDLAIELNELNSNRRQQQSEILKQATNQVMEQSESDPVIIVSHSDWNHGIVGIVAAKLVEIFKKPAFVIQEMGDEVKGSARSFGDFNLAEAIDNAKDLINKGGGHSLAAGVTLDKANLSEFKKRVNQFYLSKNLTNQARYLLPKEDVIANINDLDTDLIDNISKMEPFGNGNPKPIFKTDDLEAVGVRFMGQDNQHIKITLSDGHSLMDFLSFNCPDDFKVQVNSKVTVWYELILNEWNGKRMVEGRILHLEKQL